MIVNEDDIDKDIVDFDEHTIEDLLNTKINDRVVNSENFYDGKISCYSIEDNNNLLNKTSELIVCLENDK